MSAASFAHACRNELERQFLELLEFNINVPSSVYAKYYFDLRTLALANDLQLPLQPLHSERAARLEALSVEARCRGQERGANGRAGALGGARKWSSTERLNKPTPVILS